MGAACSLVGSESGGEPAAQSRPATATPTPAFSPPADLPTPTVRAAALPDPSTPVQQIIVPPHVQPPDRDLHELAQRLRQAGTGTLARTATTTPPARQVGHIDTFWISDEVDDEPISYAIEARIAVVTEHAYWYVDVEADLSTEALAMAAAEFEGRVHPLLTGATGDVWNPGVDNDPRFTVLHTPLVAAAGYFGSRDEYTKATHPRSNEREMIYMNTAIEPGTEVYMGVLTHEFQHAVNWNQDGGEDSWINEGLAEYATQQAGYSESFVDRFLVAPGTQFNFWPDSGRATIPHYGAAELFVHYLADHYGGYAGVGEMYALPEDGEEGVDAYMARFGMSFEDVFRDWVAANYLDSDEGIHGYPSRDVRVLNVARMAGPGDREGTLAQFGSRYFELRLGEGDAHIRFEGQPTVRQTAEDCRSGSRCWWSNRGDSVDTMLTREFDLSGLEAATLEFWAWFDIEEGWDYAYVQASGDGGRTWSVLEGEHTTTHDPGGQQLRARLHRRERRMGEGAGGPDALRGRKGAGAVRVRDGRRGLPGRAAHRRPERAGAWIQRRRRAGRRLGCAGVRAHRQQVAAVVPGADNRDSGGRRGDGAAAGAGRGARGRGRGERIRVADRAGGGGGVAGDAAHAPAGELPAERGAGAVRGGRRLTLTLTLTLALSLKGEGTFKAPPS